MTKQTEALKVAVELMERFLEHDSISSSDYIDVRNACIKALEPTVAELNDEYLRDTRLEGLSTNMVTVLLDKLEDMQRRLRESPIGIDTFSDTEHKCEGCVKCDARCLPKQWQGLSDEEIWDIANFLGKNKE